MTVKSHAIRKTLHYWASYSNNIKMIYNKLEKVQITIEVSYRKGCQVTVDRILILKYSKFKIILNVCYWNYF